MADLVFKEEVYAIIGAAMDVYNSLGPGFAEPVYQEAFLIEMTSRNIPVKSKQELAILYKGQALHKTYLADYLAYETIISEIKALYQLGSQEEAQLLNYLKATSSPLGFLINFVALHDLEWKRMVATDYQRLHHYPKTIRED
jgi:GxxExxY protein